MSQNRINWPSNFSITPIGWHIPLSQPTVRNPLKSSQIWFIKPNITNHKLASMWFAVHALYDSPTPSNWIRTHYPKKLFNGEQKGRNLMMSNWGGIPLQLLQTNNILYITRCMYRIKQHRFAVFEVLTHKYLIYNHIRQRNVEKSHN